MKTQSKPIQARVLLVVHAAALVSAYNDARDLQAKWAEAHPSRDNSDTWMFAKLECLLLPGVWEHMGRRMAGDDNGPAFRYYEKPVRGANPDGLPGYRMQPWTHTFEHPGTVFDGIRRELYGGLGEALYNAAYHLWSRRPVCPRCFNQTDTDYAEHDHRAFMARKCTTCQQAWSGNCAEGRCSRYEGYKPAWLMEQLLRYRVRVPELEEQAGHG